MQPFTERSANPEEQPGANVHSTVRMTVQEAAIALGITVEAVRGRMHRGKYGREKTEDGRVFVVLTPDQLPNGRERFDPAEAHSAQESSERLSNQSTHVRGQSSERLHEQDELVEELRDHVAFLRAELEARNQELRRREEEHREEARRKDTIIAQLTQRIPELPAASQEPSGGSATATEGAAKGTAQAKPVPEQRRSSWLYRFFFGP
jgi:hypothetical protein